MSIIEMNHDQINSEVLFFDDFKAGISPEWRMSGKNYASVNGRLVVEDGALESGIVGSESWRDYSINLSGFQAPDGTDFYVDVRIQDRNVSTFVRQSRLEFREQLAAPAWT